MLNVQTPRLFTRLVLFTLLLAFALIFSVAATAQTTVSQGSIQGTVTDASGAVVEGAKVTIISKANGRATTTSTTSSGTYNSGGLIPGDYVVRVEAKGFKTSEVTVVVQVTVTASGNVKLEVGQGNEVVEVQASTNVVNTEQATVQGVLTADQIDKLPVDGRNFMDLAQLEPGVQIQDGQTFDPTKAGYSSISINGMYGRTPRIEVDGLDISDENVGTTTQNVALEFDSGVQHQSFEPRSFDRVDVRWRSERGHAFWNERSAWNGVLWISRSQCPDGQFCRRRFGLLPAK